MKPIQISTTLGLACFLIACTGTPQTQSNTIAAAGAASTPAEPGSPEEIVCEYEEVVGSHFKRKMCMSRGERERLREQTQEAMRMKSDSTTSAAD